MVNDRKKYIIYCYIFILTIYISYLLNEDESFYKIDKVEWIKTGQENINNFILNHKSIDAIIIGGSNSAAGLSAALLSELTNKNFYNLSESSEGENDLDYLKTINLKTSNLDRNDVRVIIYSTLKLLSNDENRINNEISKPKIKLLPTTSIASNIKQKTIPYLKKYFLKNNEFKERKTVNDFDKNKIYYEHEEYGDRKITNNFDKYKVSFKFNKSMSLNLIINNLISVKNNYQKLFPNSKFIVVSPTVYNKDPEFQNSFINKLSKELLKNNIEFISQPPISDFLPIWTDPIHLNQDGRNLRTNELYKLLKNNYDLENLLK